MGIVGESGSGKSLTALSIMRLAHQATVSGEVLLQGQDLLTLPSRQMQKVRGGRVAMVYQDPMSSLNPVRTIGHQLVEAIRLHSDASRVTARRRALDMLGEVGVPQPQERFSQYPHEFSGGMRQRVMIAMAMSSGPEVLLADEPTTALDVTTQSLIIDLLDRLADDHGTGVVLITHDLGVAAGFCDTVNVMRHGEVVETAPAARLYRSPAHDYTRTLLSSVVDLTIDVDRPIRTEARPDADHPVQPAAPPAPADAEAAPLVRVEHVVKSYRLGPGEHVRAVDDASFEIRRGQTFGLVGESGSGKSTVSRAVLALTPLDAGTVSFDGRDLSTVTGPELRRLRRRMQMVFQDPYAALNRRRTVAEIVAAPLRAHKIGDRAGRRQTVDETLELVGLGPEFRNRLPRSMSGGQCQRVAIARALVLNPDFLVLDESVSSLDVSIQAQVLNLLRDLQTRLGLTYLFISHDLAVVRYMAHHVAVMRRGVIVEQGNRDELFASPEHPYTHSLMAAIPIADPERERRRRAEILT
ncbi:MAG: dipeptide ABC transporter ATP-binding protein [Propionibacteriales bacterium]|nr:dipeptide ABC transporter ATP-binding protein [Propionibacteriales bacterium]